MDHSFYDKNHLFKEIAAGDEQAFRQVFHAYNAKLYPFVLRLTRSESAAEDIIQEIFLRLWINRSEVARMEYPASWLYKVASNLSLSWLRSKAAEMRRAARMEVCDSIEADRVTDSLSAKEIQWLIMKAVDRLPPKRQEIYKLSREQGLNHEEIARILQLSPNTIKNQLVSALKFIKNYIRQESGMAVPLLILLFLN